MSELELIYFLEYFTISQPVSFRQYLKVMQDRDIYHFGKTKHHNQGESGFMTNDKQILTQPRGKTNY